MIGPLFSISPKGEFDVIDDRLYLVPEFRSLLEMKDGKKYMQFVYCVCDYYSPYVRIADDDERALRAAGDIFAEGVKPMNIRQVKVAIACYKSLQDHPLMEQYNVMLRMRSKMQASIDTLGKDKTADPKRIMGLSQDLVKYTMDMEKLEEKIKEKNAKIGGLSNLKRSLSIYEQRLLRKQKGDGE